jgi:DNA polymerase/3'-5' exonuclease PolX
MLSTAPDIVGNAALAANLRELADLLEQQGADGFRVAAYRRAADTVDRLNTPVRDILATQGRDALLALPNIGRGIASALSEMVATGRWSQLDRLRGSVEPEQLFRTIPGIGPELAQKLHDELQIETLEALEIAAHDGRLEQIEGFGPRRAEMVRTALAERLGRPRLRQVRQAQGRPPVASPGC